MGKSIVLVIGLIVLTVFTGCVGMKKTPSEVLMSYQKYQQIKAGLNDDALGEAIEKLKAFQSANARYDIAIIVEEEIAMLRARVPTQYQKARELVRQGQFERAEVILNDLATHVTDMAESKMAQDFMRFEFPMLKSNYFSLRGRSDEAQRIIQEMKKANVLSSDEVQQAERVLDMFSQSSAGGARVTCGTLRTALTEYYAYENKYPDTLSLQNLDFLGLPSEEIGANLSAIEDYEVNSDGFRFTCVSKDGRTRLLMTPRGFEKE